MKIELHDNIVVDLGDGNTCCNVIKLSDDTTADEAAGIMNFLETRFRPFKGEVKAVLVP